MKKICYVAVTDRVFKYFLNPHVKAMTDLEDIDIICMSDFEDNDIIASLPPGVKIKRVNISRDVNPINLLKNILFFTFFFKKNNFTMVQYTGPSTGLICSISSFLGKVPVRQYCLWGLRYEGFPDGIKRSFFRFLEKVSCKLSTSIILDSNANKNYGIQESLFLPKKAHVIGKGSASGIDLSVYDYNKKKEFRNNIRDAYNVPDDAFVVGYVGRLSEEKGTNDLLLAARKLINKYDNVYFMLVGFAEKNHDIEDALMTWAKEEKRVIFCGRQDQPEQFYAAFDIFAFPSYREGYGGGCIQAGAFAVPSVVSNIRPLMDAIDYGVCGAFFNLGNWQELAERISHLYECRDEKECLGVSIFKKVTKYFDVNVWMKDYRLYTEKQIELIQ